LGVQRERDKAHSGRNTATQGVATATRERDAAHAKARDARDTTRKEWDNLMTLVEEERATLLEERGIMEFKIMEATMAKRERWEDRIRAAEIRGEAAVTVAVTVGGITKLARDRYKALGSTIIGGRKRGEGRVRATEAGTSRGRRMDLLPRDCC
jgi:hypothetical protein